MHSPARELRVDGGVGPVQVFAELRDEAAVGEGHELGVDFVDAGFPDSERGGLVGVEL